MATLEDRIMGEKLQYYCSSSEDEGDDKEEEEKLGDDEFDVEKSKKAQAERIEEQSWRQESKKHNTGSKGVREDARAFQRWILEKEQEKLDKLAVAAARFSLDPVEDDLSEDEEFMAEYRAKRLQEMKARTPVLQFGTVRELTGTDYCEVVDLAPKEANVVVYIYEPLIRVSTRYKENLARIAQDFPSSMICCIRASAALMTPNFIQKGVPAFIAYKGGEVKKTWVNIRDYIGDDAEYDVLVEYMQDQGILPY